MIGKQITGVHLMDDRVYHDERGHFFESHHQQRLELLLAKPIHFVQDNLSYSRQGVLRGLHYQYQRPQAKLIRVLQGAIWDVVVDLRQSSSSFGQWVAYHLRAERPQQLFIPAGCAHGFLTLSDSALMMYKVSDYYQPEDEYCLRYDDPSVGIEWPISCSLPEHYLCQEEVRSMLNSRPILSAKDADGLNWSQIPKFSSTQV